MNTDEFQSGLLSVFIGAQSVANSASALFVAIRADSWIHLRVDSRAVMDSIENL